MIGTPARQSANAPRKPPGLDICGAMLSRAQERYMGVVDIFREHLWAALFLMVN